MAKRSYNLFDFDDMVKYALFILHKRDYHVIVHESAFQNFLKKLSRDTLACVARKHKNHVHFLVCSKDPFGSDRGILSRSLENKLDLISAERMFKNWRKRLDYFCSVTFENPSLQEMSMNKILVNLSNLYEIKQLNLPVPIMKNLFRQAKSHFLLPEWDGYTVSKDTDISEVDRTYDGNFVVRYQHTENIYTSTRYLIQIFFFKVNSKEIVRMCRECMKFEMEKDLYVRMYRCLPWEPSFICNGFVTDAWNWCHACKRVPLFQTLIDIDVYRQYRVNPYVNLHPYMILKHEYFKDGVLLKTSLPAYESIKKNRRHTCDPNGD